MDPPSICLCMIVKDEEQHLPHLLESVRPLISCWAIADTGSTDTTTTVIERELAGLPGVLVAHEWVDFGVNRTRAMALAEAQGADYVLTLDADTVLEVEPGALARLGLDAYMLCHLDAGTAYFTKRLVRSGLGWPWVGAVHEYITSEAERTCGRLDGVCIRARSVGALRSDRFVRDRALLEASVSRDPDNARDVFYLAQTCRDLGDVVAAVRWYDRRAGMGGWAEEVFYARFEAGRLLAESGEAAWPEALDRLIGAWEFRPQRLEPLYEIASRLRLRGAYQSAFAFAARGIDRPRPDDVLFLSPWVYRYGLLVEYSISAYWVGDLEACAAACERLLAMPDLPAAYRESTRQNLALCRVPRP